MNKTLGKDRKIMVDSAFEEVWEQYGVLPWRTNRLGEVEILLITSRKWECWIVPKGWPEAGRPSFLSAALQAFEKAGVIGDVYPNPIGDYRFERELAGGSRQRRRAILYSLHVHGTLINWPARSSGNAAGLRLPMRRS